ncbi:tetratricopeptide repeat domain-containing protein [Chloropicon primus]|uniref:Tetratricopeptide repeat domain-containing protein n=1 Tax=Chloropicon primus TaxID=1764295 RepID=A0A5B8MDE6_9CHLO|nr:tetratricopeptide repeat domain-containing protein [Chloropicon primus]UPQ97376.1 tetratricopeptide repeat domain-containing protein [Chloropicon primus]|eukprot:QDZ18164.1 tetratricopeptide repeat domain-containing protein [Chloropicon primus]
MVVNICLERRWADESEDDEGWTSEAMQELNEKLYPETESLRDVERFLESMTSNESASSWENEKENRDESKMREARTLLSKVETITRMELPIQIRARKAAAKALLIEYLNEGNNDVLEDAFVEAVKLDPDNRQCWNGVAKALWKKGDLQSAQLCYQKSLENSRDKKAYQDLSMLQRQLAKGEKHEESKKMIEESLSNAKAAVSLDVQDSHSWFILGNAYLVLAFSTATGERDELINKSLKTYKHAMKVHESENFNADLKFNYGVVSKYLERHTDALDAFDYCDRVEPELNAGEEINEIVHKLSQLTILVNTKCGVKAKRIAKIQEDIGALEKRRNRDPGKNLLRTLPLRSLSFGENPSGVALTCSLICTVPVKSQVPLMYICMDSQGSFFALTIYGLEESEMPLRHSKSKTLQICGPSLNNVNVTWQNKTYAFPSIRVNKVSSLLVDGKPVVSESRNSDDKGSNVRVIATTS